MTSIAEAAAQALAAKREQEEAFEAELRDTMIRMARTRLGEFFAGTGVDAEALEVVHADSEQFVTVLADPAPDPVHLAVDDDGDVRMVALVDDRWTKRSPVLPDLAALGELLEDEGAA